MDTNQLVAHARTRFDHAASRRVLKEKYEAKMVFAYCGGMWRAGPELLNILRSFTADSAVLLDLYDTPVRVDVNELYDFALQRWQEQMNGWLVEYTELQGRR